MDSTQRAAWLEKRRVTGFGGSDAAAALGLSAYKSRIQLVLEKRGEIPPTEDNEFFHWRREMEDPILREYSKRMGHTVVRPTDIVVSQKYPWMFTTYDGIVLDAASSRRANRVVQAKTAYSKDGWGEPGGDEVPDDYWVQVQHEMLVAEAPVADIPVLFHFTKMEIYTVEADAEFQKALIEQEQALWQGIRTPGWMPEALTVNDAKLRWGRESRLGRVIADPDVQKAFDRMRQIREEAGKLEAEIDEQKLVIMKAMQDNETLCDPSGLILLTWRAQKGVATFRTKDLLNDLPEVYAKYAGRGQPFRKMLIKDKP